MSNAQAFPLSWPTGIPRMTSRKKSQFGDHSVVSAVKEIRRNISLMGARLPVVSSNIPLRMDGDPYSNPGRMQDPGVAVYFQLKGKPYCMPCDMWQSVEENLWAVAKHIEAMRGMQRWGVGSVEQQFAGFKALAAQNQEAWWDVLCCRPDDDKDVIEKQYRARARTAHPDVAGGSHEIMSRLNQARESALAATGEMRY
jgi:hypothetical protein